MRRYRPSVPAFAGLGIALLILPLPSTAEAQAAGNPNNLYAQGQLVVTFAPNVVNLPPEPSQRFIPIDIVPMESPVLRSQLQSLGVTSFQVIAMPWRDVDVEQEVPSDHVPVRSVSFRDTYVLHFSPAIDLGDMIEDLREVEGIDIVRGNPRLFSMYWPSDEYLTCPGTCGRAYQWNFHNTGDPVAGVDCEEGFDVGLMAAYDIQNECSVKIGLADTGVADDVAELDDNLDTDLARNYVPGIDEAFWQDPDGHGTATAGIIAAEHSASPSKVIGIAGNPASSLTDGTVVPLRILYNDPPNLQTSLEAATNLIDALADMEDAFPAVPIVCINAAIWEGSEEHQLTQDDVDPLRDAVYNIFNAGVFLPTAAGNLTQPGGSAVYPASFRDMVLAAATVGCDGTSPATYQSGPNVDLAAPGTAWNDTTSTRIQQIVTTWLDDEYTGIDLGFFGATSSANPHVAGAAGLLLSHTPELTNEDVRELLQRTARDLDPSGRDDVTGHGLLRIDNALAALDTLTLVHDSTSTLTVKPVRYDSCEVRTWRNISIVGTYATHVGNEPQDYYSDKYCLLYTATATDLADSKYFWVRGRQCVSAIDLAPSDTYDGHFTPYAASVDTIIGQTAYLHGHTYRFWTDSACSTSLGWYPLKVPLPPGGLSDDIFSWSYLKEPSTRGFTDSPHVELGIRSGQTYFVGSSPSLVRFYSHDGLGSELEVFDAAGRKRASIVIPGSGSPGWVDASWGGLDDNGKIAPSGIYFGRLRAAGESVRLRFVVIR